MQKDVKLLGLLPSRQGKIKDPDFSMRQSLVKHFLQSPGDSPLIVGRQNRKGDAPPEQANPILIRGLRRRNILVPESICVSLNTCSVAKLFWDWKLKVNSGIRQAYIAVIGMYRYIIGMHLIDGSSVRNHN